MKHEAMGDMMTISLVLSFSQLPTEQQYSEAYSPGRQEREDVKMLLITKPENWL